MSVVAPEMSVLFVVVELDGWADAAALLPLPKSPPWERDSPARESEVTTPAPSTFVLA